VAKTVLNGSIIASSGAEEQDDRQTANLTTTAYEQLRNDVLSGRLRPGEKLGAEALRRRFNIGSSPIREALNRLLAEGLVALEEQKGFRVSPVSEAELRELVTARSWIDGAAITEAVRRQDSAWEEQIIVALHRLSRTKRYGPQSETKNDWEAKHRAFHAALVGGCGSRWIIRISDQLFDAAERYRMLGLEHVPERNELDEHKAIVEACLEGDAARAVALLTEHYGQTYKVVVHSFLNKQ
jgi:DNA-binding GntR family transcriptional regulator